MFACKHVMISPVASVRILENGRHFKLLLVLVATLADYLNKRTGSDALLLHNLKVESLKSFDWKEKASPSIFMRPEV